MGTAMRAIEVIGTIDEKGQLHLDAPVSHVGAGRVRVILLQAEDDIDEKEWLRSAANNPAFEFLKGPAEDIYTRDDGKPFNE